MSIFIKWLAHAAFQIKTEEKTIYLDPRYMKKFAHKIGSFFENPEKADIILMTHHHADHCYPSSIERMRVSNTIIIAPKGCTRKIGGEVRTIKPGQEIMIDNIQIKAVEAYNIEPRDSSKKIWHRRGDGVGYLITLEGKTVYHAGDTDFIPEMGQLGSIDVALLPIGGTFTMNIGEAVRAAIAIKPRIVIPMHNLKADCEEFKNKVEAKSDIKVVPLKIGGVYHWK